MDFFREAGAARSGAAKETKMDLRLYVTPIPGAQAAAATRGARIPRRALTVAAGMVAMLLLGVAVGRGLPAKPEASPPVLSAQGPSPATEPVVSYVNVRPQVVDQPVSEEYIPTF